MSELPRRLIHASGSAAPAIYLLGIVTWEQLGWLLVLGTVIALGLECCRLFLGLDWWIYEELTREYEQDTVAGYALYMFSMTGVASVFEPMIAVPAMLMLTIGDPVSGYLGSGELRNVKRTSALVAMFVVCFALALPFVWNAFATPIAGIIAAGLAAVVATIADGVKPVIFNYVIDDNITIPFGAAATLWIVVQFLPGS